MGERFLYLMAKLASVRMACCELYQLLVFEGHCTPIEHLDPQEKQELWDWVNHYQRELHLNQKEKIQAARAYHGLGSYIRNLDKITT